MAGSDQLRNAAGKKACGVSLAKHLRLSREQGERGRAKRLQPGGDRTPGGGERDSMARWLGLPVGAPGNAVAGHCGPAESTIIGRHGRRGHTGTTASRLVESGHKVERGPSTAKRKQPGDETWVTRKAVSARDWRLRKELEIDGLTGVKRRTLGEEQDERSKRRRDSGNWGPAAEAEPSD